MPYAVYPPHQPYLSVCPPFPVPLQQQEIKQPAASHSALSDEGEPLRIGTAAARRRDRAAALVAPQGAAGSRSHLSLEGPGASRGSFEPGGSTRRTGRDLGTMPNDPLVKGRWAPASSCLLRMCMHVKQTRGQQGSLEWESPCCTGRLAPCEVTPWCRAGRCVWCCKMCQPTTQSGCCSLQCTVILAHAASGRLRLRQVRHPCSSLPNLPDHVCIPAGLRC